jgi:hypothetical protein
MMLVRHIWTDLREPGSPLAQVLGGEKAQGMVNADICVKCQLGAGPQTYRHIRLAVFRQAPCDAVTENGRYQPITDLCRPRCQVLK